MKRVLGAGALCWVLAPAALLACPICFGATDAATASGVRAAIFTLVGVTAGVLTVFGVMLVRFLRRS